MVPDALPFTTNAIHSGQLSEIEAPDLNVVSGVASMQGYGSIVDGTYASATGTHSPTGDRGAILDPRAVGDGTLDQLDTRLLFAPRDYFLVSAHSDPATPDPAAGERRLPAGGRATWYLGGDMVVKSIVIPDANAEADVEDGLRLGAVTPGGATLWAPGRSRVGAQLVSATFDHAVGAVALVTNATRLSASFGSPSVTTSDGAHYIADGQLEGVVVPPRWAFRGMDGSFAAFTDQLARPALTLRGPAGASLQATAGPTLVPSQASVSSLHGIEVIRSEAAIPGWIATWNPDTGPTVMLPVRDASAWCRQ